MLGVEYRIPHMLIANLPLTKVYLLTGVVKFCNGFQVKWSSESGVTFSKQLNDGF